MLVEEHQTLTKTATIVNIPAGIWGDGLGLDSSHASLGKEYSTGEETVHDPTSQMTPERQKEMDDQLDCAEVGRVQEIVTLWLPW